MVNRTKRKENVMKTMMNSDVRNEGYDTMYKPKTGRDDVGEFILTL